MVYDSTFTDIANMALDWCGASLSIDDINNKNNPDAILCRRNLEQAVTTELDKYEWTFARTTIPAERNEDPDCQIAGYLCYDLPKDFSRLSMYRFFDDFAHSDYVPNEYRTSHYYFIQNKHLYIKRPIQYITYQSNNVPITDWPALFKDIVALNLAQRIVSKIRGLDADISFFISLYKEKLKDARHQELITTEAVQGGFSPLQVQRIIP